VNKRGVGGDVGDLSTSILVVGVLGLERCTLLFDAEP
jgi:hypothetical protein